MRDIGMPGLRAGKKANAQSVSIGLGERSHVMEQPGIAARTLRRGPAPQAIRVRIRRFASPHVAEGDHDRWI